MSTSPSFDARALLAEVGWVRALARQLADDEHQAEDLVQETMTAAVATLRREPVRLDSIRAWLLGVLRNIARATRRKDRHRADREAAASRTLEMPSTVDLMERASAQRSLVGVLLRLEEPYRETLLLKFFDELSHREIARRMGVSESTVGTRAKRGLERMREKLRRRHGGGAGTWLGALLPLREWTNWTGNPILGSTSAAIVMSVQAKVLLSLGALLGVFFVYRLIDTRAETARAALPAMDAPSALSEPTDPRAVGASLATREAHEKSSRVEAPLDSAPSFVEPDSVLVSSIRGRVIDLDGRAVVGVEVRVGSHVQILRVPKPPQFELFPQIPELRATSGADGRFELHGSVDYPNFVAVAVESDVYSTVLAGMLQWNPGSSTADGELVVVVGWRLPLGGRVVDEDGNPIEDVHLRVSGGEWQNALGVVLDRSTTSRCSSPPAGSGPNHRW